MVQANETALRSFADVVSERDRHQPISPRELVHNMRGCSAILSLNGQGAEDITPAVLRAVRSIRVVCIAHYWGPTHFGNVTGSTRIPVIEGSNVGTAAVVEWIVAAALMGIRRVHVFDRALKAGSAWGEPRRTAGMLAGSVAGLIGLGRIGRYTARRFQALGVDVVAYSRSCSVEAAERLGVKLVGLHELLQTADIISLGQHVTDATRGSLGPREFALIKPGAVFINAARAALYDEAALVKELQTGRFTAFLDVFAVEPLPADHPFRSMDNVVVTPHIAGNNAVMFQRCGRDAIEALREFFAAGALVDKRYRYP
jgi:phosphoglycerate dehydrogenase-like enzyme